MTSTQACPDELFSRARRGLLSVREDEMFREHVDHCSDCRDHLATGDFFDRVIVAQPGDDALALRVAMSVASRRVGTSPSTARRQLRKTGWYLLAAAVLFVSTVAAAPFARRALHRFEAIHRSAHVLAPLTSLQLPLHSSAREHHQDQVSDVVATEFHEVSAAPLIVPAARVIAHRRARATTSAESATSAPIAESPVASVTPRDLFAQANAARHENRVQDALALYSQLQREFPASVESVVSCVSAGRLLLERQRDAAGALSQFDRFLAQSAHSALVEEALFGRASALQRLGRIEDERATWRTLVERFPGSVYADRARARLSSMR